MNLPGIRECCDIDLKNSMDANWIIFFGVHIVAYRTVHIIDHNARTRNSFDWICYSAFSFAVSFFQDTHDDLTNKTGTVPIQSVLDEAIAAPFSLKQNSRPPCHVCGVHFSNKANLDRHLRSHFGIKPYACKLCSVRCTQKSNLHQHINIVHKMPAVDKYVIHIQDTDLGWNHWPIYR